MQDTGETKTINRRAEFTEEQMRTIYVFLEQYVDKPNRPDAKQALMSILLFDRYKYKERLSQAISEVL